MNCNHIGPFVKLEDRWIMCQCGATFREMTPEASERVLFWQRNRLTIELNAQEREYLETCYRAMGGTPCP